MAGGASGLCNAHKHRLRRYGDPHRGDIDRELPIAEMMWRYTRYAGPDECWVFMGTRHSYGYGLVRGQYAHRVALELSGVVIPDGMEVDHACRNRSCVNPSHLRVCTRGQNAANTPARKNSRSGIKGVWLAKGKWFSQIRSKNKVYSLGSFATAQEAARARDEMAARLHGDFFLSSFHQDEKSA